MDAAIELTLKHICDHYERCYELLSSARETLMRFDGVVGIGIGPKQTNYRLDSEQTCFLVYVEEKKHAAALRANQFIPKQFAGIATDVVEVGSRKIESHNHFDNRWLSQSGLRSVKNSDRSELRSSSISL